MNYIALAFESVEQTVVAKACKVTPQAVWKWKRAGRLPKTEWLPLAQGGTRYAKIIAKLAGIPASMLLMSKRSN